MTQQRLKELLDYNPDTGVFTWKVSPRRGIHPGEVAGQASQKIRVDTVLYKASRLAWLYMTGHWPLCEVDHRNRNPQDNRWENLRDVTGRVNSQNVGRKKNNTSGYIGVSWDKKYQKWAAYLMLDRKKIHLGYFKSKEDAAEARKKAESYYWRA